MNLTPAQSALARAAARRILRAQIAALRDGAPCERVALPYHEAQCLLAAAGGELGLPPDALDLGPWHSPPPPPDRLFHAYVHDADGRLAPCPPR